MSVCVFKELLKLFREPFYPVYICDSTSTTQQHYLSLTTIIHHRCNAYIMSENERVFFFFFPFYYKDCNPTIHMIMICTQPKVLNACGVV